MSRYPDAACGTSADIIVDMTPRTRWLLLGFALLGLLFSGGAAYVHYRLLTEPNYVSPCDINATFNCSEVYLSRFGSVRGIPVALGGLIWFAVVALIVGLSEPPPKGSEDAAGAYVFALATLGLAAILYLAYASFFVLRTGCLLCMGTYVAVVGIFVVSGTAASIPMTRLPGRFLRDVRGIVARPARLVAALLLVVLAIFGIVRFPREATLAQAAPAVASATVTTASDNAQKRFEDLWAAQPRIDLGIPADGAKVVIVKFNDWQCPSCKLSYFAYKPVLDKYAQTMPGAVKYVTKDYPLNSRCNFSISREMHAGACEAAVAVRVANEKGKAEQMISWLFSNQEALTPQSVQAQAKSMLGVVDFNRDYVRFLPEIKRDAADGAALNVQYTPTYYVNGVKAQANEGTWLAAEYFDYAIQYELKKAGGSSPR
jgi:uncharacterized membrane protein/protein-disulfide isomerase